MPHFVIVIPGLGDRRVGITFITCYWRLFGLQPVIHTIGWDSGPFGPKLERLLQKIDELAARGTVSVVGLSAGASAGLNAFGARADKVHRMVSVCGCLRVRNRAVRGVLQSAAFRESVTLSESRGDELSMGDKQRILTIYPQFGDSRIKPEDSLLNGAPNIAVPSGGHALSIGLSLTLFAKPLIDFLKR